MSGKYHYYWYDVESGIPKYMLEDYRKELKHGAICGYIRPRVTSITTLVTCKLCLREMKKKGLIK